MESLTARASTHGRTDLSMLVNSCRVSSMEKAVGRVRRVLSQAISTKETTSTTKSTGMGCSPGQAAINIKVSIERMSAMGTVR
jgi:hypothetical protein